MQRELELSGIIGEDGQLSRPFHISGVKVPQCEVELIGDGDDAILCYPLATPLKLKTAVRGLLDSFIKLSDGRPEDILRFAKTWGPLRVCQHWLPYGKCPAESWDLGREPIYVWRQCAQRSQAILKVASKLHLSEFGDPADWMTALGLGTSWTTLWWKWNADPAERLTEEKSLLMVVVNTLVIMAELQINLTWSLKRPEWDLVPDGSLFGALVCQLAFAVAVTEAVATCTSCGRPYSPKRKPQVGRRNYCPTCGARAAKRDHARGRRKSLN